MPRANKDGEVRAGRGSRQRFSPDVDPFSSNADTETVADWDSRPEEIASVLLKFLARGQAIMIGVSRDGQVVSVGVNIGEKQWSRRHARDGGEWIGIWHDLAVWLRMQELSENPPAPE